MHLAQTSQLMKAGMSQSEAEATGLIGLVLDFIDLTIIVLLNLIIEAINTIAFGAGPDKIDPMGEKFIDRPADGWADMLHPEYQ